ncbi:MAG: YbhN family protein [Candidatus Acidiferrales bacterium]
MTADLDQVVPLPPKSKVKRYLFALVLSGLAVYFFLPRFTAMGHAFLVISNLKIPFVVFSVVAQLLSYLGSGYLLKTVVRLASKPISMVDGVLMTAGANSVGTLGGGVIGTAAMTYLWLRRRGVNAGAAGLGGWLPIFLNNTVLAIVSLAGLIIIIHLKKSSRLLVAGFSLVFVILGAALAAFILCLLYREKLAPVAMALGRFFAKLRHKPLAHAKIEAAVGHVLEGWDALLRGGWRGPAVGAILNTGFDMLTLGLFFWAAGYRIGVTVLVAGYGIPQLLGKLTVILGGVGIVEAGMVGLYVLLGTPRPIAVIAVLAYRLLSFWIPTLAGLALIPYLERSTATSGQTTGPIESAGETGT